MNSFIGSIGAEYYSLYHVPDQIFNSSGGLYEALRSAIGVVVVGKMNPVFGDTASYKSFLRCVHGAEIPVVGVIDKGFTFPNGNWGLDGLIEKTQGEIIHTVARKTHTIFTDFFKRHPQ